MKGASAENVDDPVEVRADLAFAEAEEAAAGLDVLPAGEVGMEAHAELEERCHPPVDGDASDRRLGRAGQ